MTFGDQGNSQPKTIAPEWQPACRKGSRELNFDRLIQQLGIAF